jgi:O-antigen ligase
MKYLKQIIEYGLYLFVFFLPWQTRWIIRTRELNGGYFEPKTISLYGTDILLLVVLLLNCFYQLRILPTGRQVKNYELKITNGFKIYNLKFKISSTWWLIAGLDLFIFISIFFAPNKLVAVYHYGWFLLGAGLFWLVASVEYNKAKLLWGLVAGAVLQAGLAVYQFLTQSTFASKWLGMALHSSADLGVSVIETLNGERWLRAYGGLDHPNVLGGFLVIALLLILNFKFLILNQLSNFKFQKYFLLSTFYFLLFTSIFFTFSRSAWLGLIIGLAIAFAMALIKKDLLAQKQIIKFSVIGVFALLIMGNIYSDLLSPRLVVSTRLEQKSITERVESVAQAKKLIKKNWLFGVGIGNYTLALVEQNPGQPAWTYQPVHNTPLLVLAEIGIFGFIFFVAMLCAMCYVLCRSIIKDKNSESTLNLAMLVALIVMFQFDHFWWSLHFGVLLSWFSLGLIYHSIHSK